MTSARVAGRPSAAPSGRRARLSEVAALAGVSVGTVSNVLNRPARVTPATRARVEDAIHRLAYTPDRIASALARGATRTVGLVVVGLSNSLFVDVARGAQEAARNGGRYLQLATAENDHGLLREHMTMLTGSLAAGLLVAPMEDVSDAVERARAAGCPVVLLNHDGDRAACCRVLVDNEQVGRIAAQHLIDRGRRRIAFIGGDDRLQPIALRRRGVREAVRATGGAVRLEEFDAVTIEAAGGIDVARRLASRPVHERPDAVIGVSDLLAMAAISEFRALGLRVPQDVAVMGCDHNSAAWGGAIPLTSVTMEGEAMGAEGVRLLLREIADGPGEHVHTTTTLEPRLMPRASTVADGR